MDKKAVDWEGLARSFGLLETRSMVRLLVMSGGSECGKTLQLVADSRKGRLTRCC